MFLLFLGVELGVEGVFSGFGCGMVSGRVVCGRVACCGSVRGVAGGCLWAAVWGWCAWGCVLAVCMAAVRSSGVPPYAEGLPGCVWV